MLQDDESKVIDISPIVSVKRSNNPRNNTNSYTVKYILKFFDGTTKPIDIMIDVAKDREDAIEQARIVIDKGIKVYCSGVNELEEI
jgi:hypothetical protein